MFNSFSALPFCVPRFFEDSRVLDPQEATVYITKLCIDGIFGILFLRNDGVLS